VDRETGLSASSARSLESSTQLLRDYQGVSLPRVQRMVSIIQSAHVCVRFGYVAKAINSRDPYGRPWWSKVSFRNNVRITFDYPVDLYA